MQKFRGEKLASIGDKGAFTHNNRMQSDFGELAFPSAADARR